MGNVSTPYEELGYTRRKNTGTQSVAIWTYAIWQNALKQNFRNTLDTTKTYSTEDRQKIVVDYMQANVRYELPKYKGTADYGVKWREIKRMLMWAFSTAKGSYDQEIAKTNALINQILAEEHVAKYADFYNAEWIE